MYFLIDIQFLSNLQKKEAIMYFYSFEDGKKLKFKSDEKVDGINRRKMPRSPCLILSKYFIEETVYQSFILDINRSGAFIETDKRFDVGKKIFLDLIFMSNRPTPGHKYFYGTIKWSTDIHMGIQFN